MARKFDECILEKYEKGILDTNLSLLSVPDDKIFRVHASELVKYSKTLADLGCQAMEDSVADDKDAVLRFEDVSAATLSIFTGVIYGSSLKKRLNICNLADFSKFGHKFQSDEIEAMLCEVVNCSTLLSPDQSSRAATYNAYKSVPIEFGE